jgi:ABC-type transport system involved in Fe-S cluster assembly fused permease/ATPase subunit
MNVSLRVSVLDRVLRRMYKYEWWLGVGLPAEQILPSSSFSFPPITYPHSQLVERSQSIMTLTTRPLSTAMSILDYAHAPESWLCFLAALIFSLCTLQKPVPLGFKERWISTCVMLALVISYIAQALYYLSMASKDSQTAPQHSIIHALYSILAWGLLMAAVSKAKSILWQPYLGVFVIHVLSIVTVSTHDQSHNISPYLRTFRILLSLVLLVLVLHLVFRSRHEKCNSEQSQPLLNNTGDPSDDNTGREQQKRLEQEGGWIGYIKRFAIFLPYLFPREQKIIACLGFRMLYLVLCRFLNPLEPHQIGVIMDKLATGSGMPWMDISWWAFYKWARSTAGLGMLDRFAMLVLRTDSYKRISVLAFDHAMKLSADYHNNKTPSSIINSIDQVSSLNALADVSLYQVAPLVLDIFISLWYVTHVYGVYATFVFLSTGIAHTWLGISLANWARATRKAYNKAIVEVGEILSEALHKWAKVTYLKGESFETEQFAVAIQHAISTEFSHSYRTEGGNAVRSLFSILGLVVCFSIVAHKVYLKELSAGSLVTLLLYWSNMMGPMQTLVFSYRSISRNLIDAEELLQLLTTEPSVVDLEHAQDITITEFFKVEFDNVTFAHDPRNPILNGVSFVAEAGEKVAIVGGSGAGKSTILKLIFRLHDVTSGVIKINDKDIREYTMSSLRDVLGVVSQESSLFDASVGFNVCYPVKDAREEDVIYACEAAAIHEKISSFPDGYESLVGTNGINVSGGESQRITIANLLMGNPKIILLDEATAALDSITEKKVQEGILKATKGKTILEVAHRLPTIVDAVQILVMKDGKIFEQGTHSELLQKDGDYAELWRMQMESHGKVE